MLYYIYCVLIQGFLEESDTTILNTETSLCVQTLSSLLSALIGCSCLVSQNATILVSNVSMNLEACSAYFIYILGIF